MARGDRKEAIFRDEDDRRGNCDQGGDDGAAGLDRGATRHGSAKYGEPGDRRSGERGAKKREIEETSGQNHCDR